MVRMVAESERPRRSRATTTTTTTTSPARVVQQRREARAVVADPEELVVNMRSQPAAVSVALLVEGLLVGADPEVADSRHVALRRIDVPYDAHERDFKADGSIGTARARHLPELQHHR